MLTLRPHGDTKAEVKGSLKTLGFIVWETWRSVRNFMAVHPRVGLTDITICIYSIRLLLAQLKPYWWVPHSDSVINTWADVKTLMYIVRHKCKNLPPSNHKACPIRPSLMSLVWSDKAMYWTCMYDTHIFITLITPAAVIIPAWFWFIMYSSPENRGIVCFFFLSQIWNIVFLLRNPVCSLNTFPPAIVFAVGESNELMCVP